MNERDETMVKALGDIAAMKKDLAQLTADFHTVAILLTYGFFGVKKDDLVLMFPDGQNVSGGSRSVATAGQPPQDKPL